MDFLGKWAQSKRRGQVENMRAIDILVVGVHVHSEAYPNTLYRLGDIRGSGQYSVVEINVPMRIDSKLVQKGAGKRLLQAWRFLKAHCVVLRKYLAVKRPRLVYVPYPAVFILFLLSLLPRHLRPDCIIVDAFISIYDTAILDRQVFPQRSLIANLLKRIEKRAYNLASNVIVDTSQNASHLSELFGIDKRKFIDIPLSTNEVDFQPVPYAPKPKTCKVLFIGTLIPLHGIRTIIEAAQLLLDREDVEFRIIGDGQDSPIIERFMSARFTRLDWVRAWQPSRRLAREIAESDICLGIFGSGGKTQRVCPLKLYAYACIGRPIITGNTQWVKDTTEQLGYSPFHTVPVSDPICLAEKIAWLADNPAARIDMSDKSRHFYTEYLCNHIASKKIDAFLHSI